MISSMPIPPGMSAAPPLLEIADLSIRFGAGSEVISNMSISVAQGETLAIVGESGSGKSVTSLSILRLNLNQPRMTGAIRFTRRDGSVIDTATAPESALRRVRGNEIAMIFQEPMSSLNPVLRVGDQISEAVLTHRQVSMAEARAEAIEALQTVGVPNAERRLSAYPYELSGGLRQRVMIAMALACRPRLLIADEPTTALDVTIQAQILELLADLKRKFGMGLIFVTHDLGVVAEIADRVAVMYAGRIVETGTTQQVLDTPRHPYTAGLLGSLPEVDENGRRLPLRPIPGSIPSLVEPPPGCRFHPRCTHARYGVCTEKEPELETLPDGRRVRCVRWREIMENMGAAA